MKFSKSGIWLVSIVWGVLAVGCDGGGRDPILGGVENAGIIPAVVPPEPPVPPVPPAPTVDSVVPANDASGIPINTAVVAAFSEPMAALSGTAFTITCLAPCTNPSGTVALNNTGDTATFTLLPATTLEPLTDYTATIEGATSLATNVALASPYIWHFTTGATAITTRPRVTLTVPATSNPGPTIDVPTNTAITAVFSRDMAPASLTEDSFMVTCAAPCVSPDGSVSYVISSRTAVFTPTAPLAVSETYTVTLTTAVTDLAANALAGNQAPLPAASDYIWAFTTGTTQDSTAPTVSATNPVDVDVDVCANKTINATFSEPMNPLTINASTFTLSVTAGASVSGVVVYDAATRIATFNPTTNLTGSPATNYTATIHGGADGVKDAAGNALSSDNVTTFTTNASTCATAPALGAAAPFGAFGGNATLTNDGLDTVIHGDVGANAASSSITGLRDSAGNVYTVTTDNDGLVDGLVHTLTAPPGSVAGAVVTQARVDALAAFNSLSPASLPGGIDVSSLAQCPSCGGAGGGPDELAGRTLPPGVYMSTTGTYDIGGVGRTTDNLTLDGDGDANAVWVFQTAAGIGTLNVGLTGPATPAVPIQVLLINGAQAKNVFWYVPAGASIGTGSTMVGTMLADASITISTAGGSPPTAVITVLNGRAIALTAGVTVVNTVINVPDL